MLARPRKFILIALLLCVVLLVGMPSSAQNADSHPVVYGVLFYSPTCPHCHTVIQDYVPQWEAEFGDSLVLLFVDVSQQGGSMLAYATCDALGVESCGSVPMMVIGETVMIGSRDIPAQTPGLIRNGLVEGGVDMPPVAELQQAYAQFVAANQVTESTTTDPQEQAAVVAPEAQETATWLDKLKRDPEGNAVAVVTLVGLIASLGIGLWYGPKGLLDERAMFHQAAVILLIGAGIVLAASLISNGNGETLAMAASGGMLVLLLWAGIIIGMGQFTAWLIPVAATAGLLVAFYLTQVETGSTEISCGLIGDCGTVQQSKYAELFGILPVGVLGIFGYGLILALWAISRWWAGPPIFATYAQAGLLAAALVGVAFSIYFTFLEPFVIGATCTWCISSAVIMMLLWWMAAPAGWHAWEILRRADPEAQHFPIKA